MNVGFILTGVLVIAGAVVLWRAPQFGNAAGKALLILAGAGYIVAGFAPADQHENIHVVLGAVPIFFAGNLGLLVLAIRPWATQWLRATTLLCGVVGCAGTVLFLGHHYLGVGMGGMERVAAWPLLLLLVGAAVMLLRSDGNEPRTVS